MRGQLGVIKNLTVNHNLDNPDYGVIQCAPGVIVQKMIEINLSFGVIHEKPLGWQKTGEEQKFQQSDANTFPYGALLAVANRGTVNE